MSGLLSLKWNNHSSVFLNLLQNLRSKELYCDTTIACQGNFYPVHKLVLSSCSEYFEEIFQRTHCKHPFIIMKDVNPEDLESLLNYMYKGEVNVLQEALARLIKAAECLKIKGLAVPDEPPNIKDTTVREKRRHTSSNLTSQPKKCRIVDKTKHIENVSQNSSSHSVTEPLMEELYGNADYIKESPNSQIEDSYSSHSNDNSSVHTSNEVQDGGSPGENDSEETLFPEEVFIKSEPAEDTVVEMNAKDEDISFNSLIPHKSVNETDPVETANFLNQPYQECGEPSGTCEDSQETQMATYLMSHSLLLPTIQEAEKDKFIMRQCNKDSTQPYNTFKHNCSYCSYGSYSSSAVKKHEMRIHTGIKPFECNQCPYSSTTHEGLRIHIRSHTGERPYQCPLCPHRSSCYANLKKHTSIHKLS